jgi:hypothetical protein
MLATINVAVMGENMAPPKLEQNKERVLEFYEQAIGRGNFQAAHNYMAPPTSSTHPALPRGAQAGGPSSCGSARIFRTTSTRSSA